MAAFSEKIAVSDDADGHHSFRVISFRGLELGVRDVDGFFDANKLCQSAKKKLYAFQRTKMFKTLDEKLVARLKLDGIRGIHDTNERLVANRTKCGLTFYHPLLFLGLAWWCGVQYYVESAVLVHAFFDSSRERREQFERLCAFADESAEDRFAWLKQRVREYLSWADSDSSTTQRRFCDPSTYRKVEYANTDFIINTRRRRRMFFNATRFCRQRAYKLATFAKKEKYRELERQLSRYFEIVIEKNTDVAEAYYGETYQYVHPILFVQLAAWIDVDVYVEVARLVLAHCTNNVDLREGCAWTASSSDVAEPVANDAATRRRATSSRVVGDVDEERATTSGVHVDDDDDVHRAYFGARHRSRRSGIGARFSHASRVKSAHVPIVVESATNARISVGHVQEVSGKRKRLEGGRPVLQRFAAGRQRSPPRRAGGGRATRSGRTERNYTRR